MKIETIGIQNDHKQVPGQAISESMMMELEIGFSKHRLDDGLTFIWGNAAFYRLTGIAKMNSAPDIQTLEHTMAVIFAVSVNMNPCINSFVRPMKQEQRAFPISCV